MGVTQSVHGFGGHLAVYGRDGEHLVAGILHGSGLVDGDMARIRGHRPLMGPQDGGDYRAVGLGAAHQEVHRGLWYGAEFSDALRRQAAEGVLPVAGRLDLVGPGDARQHGRVGAFHVIAVKSDHNHTS